jgi:hypothetical protein
VCATPPRTPEGGRPRCTSASLPGLPPLASWPADCSSEANTSALAVRSSGRSSGRQSRQCSCCLMGSRRSSADSKLCMHDTWMHCLRSMQHSWLCWVGPKHVGKHARAPVFCQIHPSTVEVQVQLYLQRMCMVLQTSPGEMHPVKGLPFPSPNAKGRRW